MGLRDNCIKWCESPAMAFLITRSQSNYVHLWDFVPKCHTILHYHHQNESPKWGNNFWKNDVHPSNGVQGFVESMPRCTEAVLVAHGVVFSFNLSPVSSSSDGVAITVKSCPNEKSQMNGEASFSETCSARLKDGTKLKRDLNTNNSKDNGRWSRPSQVRKAGVYLSYVNPREQMSIATFMLALISSTKSQLSSLLRHQRAGHCQYPQRTWEESSWVLRPSPC